MPKFTDVKILDYVEKSNYRNQTFAEWIEADFAYQVATDPQIQAIEQAYYSKKRSELPLSKEFGSIVQMEHDLLNVLTDMEMLGVYVDKQELYELSSELQAKSRLLLAEMQDLVGETFNPLSAKQVQHILYDRMRIPTGKKIKTGFSVDSETLAEIAKSHAIAGMILDYRGYEKLRSTYCEWLIEHINPETHRIHTTYKQTFTSTGRLSSENPNLQNIPAGDGYAARIKSAFRPESADMQYVVADYSQVELRVLAMLSWDENLLQVFKNGEDIHTRTAKFLFPTYEKITSDQRRIAKSVNFGVIYGITGFGLSKMIKTSPKDATIYIDTFFAQYPKVRTYYDDIITKAKTTGYVETYYGRRRTIKGLNDANSMMRAAAEREAINMPVQGTAADIVKLAMIQLQKEIHAGNIPGQLIMQVHDELVLEVPNAWVPEAMQKLADVMEGILSIGGISLKVDVHSGKNWTEAKD